MRKSAAQIFFQMQKCTNLQIHKSALCTKTQMQISAECKSFCVQVFVCVKVIFMYE